MLRFLAAISLIVIVRAQTFRKLNKTSRVFNVFQVTKFPNEECAVGGTKVNYKPRYNL